MAQRTHKPLFLIELDKKRVEKAKNGKELLQMNWFSKFFNKSVQAPDTKQQKEPEKFPEWLQQQIPNCDDLSIQEALDIYIEVFMTVEQIDDSSEISKILPIQRIEVDLLEQLASKYGESASPEFKDLLFHKKLVLKMNEDFHKTTCETQKILQDAKLRAKMTNHRPKKR